MPNWLWAGVVIVNLVGEIHIKYGSTCFIEEMWWITVRVGVWQRSRKRRLARRNVMRRRRIMLRRSLRYLVESRWAFSILYICVLIPAQFCISQLSVDNLSVWLCIVTTASALKNYAALVEVHCQLWPCGEQRGVVQLALYDDIPAEIRYGEEEVIHIPKCWSQMVDLVSQVRNSAWNIRNSCLMPSRQAHLSNC